jgi:serine/threonine protein kinase, bacterial
MAPLYCPKGHAQDCLDARFCKTCGAPIATASPTYGVCQNGHPQLRAGANFCYACGARVGATTSRPLTGHPLNGICANGHPQVRRGARFCYQCGAAVNPLGRVTPPPTPAGPLIHGRYEVLGELGRGGMGSVVYKVADTHSNGQLRALKEIHETQLQPANERPQIVQAFQREAELLRRLEHPNIVKVHDSFQIGQKHYMAMDLVQGRMLEDMLAGSPGGLPESRVLAWADQLCEALSYLHSQQPPIIYRDMKPQNAMVEDAGGQIKIVDFGIAREYKGGQKRGDTIRFGTAGYAPPEQYSTSQVETSPASDVYALAAMLHQLLSGKDPTDNPFQFDFLILSRPPIAASARVIDALKKALDKKPAWRYQTIAEFQKALTGNVPKPKSPKKAKARPDRARRSRR